MGKYEPKSAAMKEAGRASENAFGREQAIHHRYSPLITATKPLIGDSIKWPVGSDFADSYPIVLTHEGVEYQVTTLGTLRNLVGAARIVEGEA